jgi:hypothetical protein
MNSLRTSRSAIALLGLFALASIASAADEMPETTPEGLVLIENTKLNTVYVRPGATLDHYTKVVLFDVEVAFRKDWDRDYNRTVLPGTTRVRPKDMERIKAGLAEEFKTVFTEELQDKRGYEVVETADYDVLVVKAAIINLDVTAPQLRGTSNDRNVITSAGQMTLWMELHDSVTGELIARVIDPAVDNRNGLAFRASTSGNKSAARKILSEWASILGENMGEISTATALEEDEE